MSDNYEGSERRKVEVSTITKVDLTLTEVIVPALDRLEKKQEQFSKELKALDKVSHKEPCDYSKDTKKETDIAHKRIDSLQIALVTAVVILLAVFITAQVVS